MPPKSRRIPVADETPPATATGPTSTETAAVDASTAFASASAITNDGLLDIEATTGDHGARELEVSAAQDVFDGLAGRIDLGEDAGALVANASSFVVEMFKHRPKPWSQLSKAEQQDLIRGVEHNVHELVRQIAEAVVANGAEPVRCLFVGFTDKGDDIKAELKLKALSKEDTEKAVLFFHRARGEHVMVTLASANEFHRDPANDSSEEDQRGLDFEAGTDEVELDVHHPDDDSDLVEAGGDQAGPNEPRAPLPEDTTEVVHTGDQLIIGQIGICEARIDLKKGWVQALRPGEDREAGDSWFDVRQASPAELAAERERTADFGVEEEVATAE